MVLGGGGGGGEERCDLISSPHNNKKMKIERGRWGGRDREWKKLSVCGHQRRTSPPPLHHSIKGEEGNRTRNRKKQAKKLKKIHPQSPKIPSLLMTPMNAAHIRCGSVDRCVCESTSLP